jgi:hypothetical protein
MGLVEVSTYSACCADKLFFARLVELVAPEPFARFVPRSRGLRELSLDSAHTNSSTRIERLRARLGEEFPHGFLVKPAGGMNSDKQGIYFNEEEFFRDLSQAPEKFLPAEPVPCPLSGIVASGESYLAQEKVSGIVGEFRLYTLGDALIPDATYTRWDEDWDLSAFRRVNAAVEDFLRALPTGLTERQAWSMDVLETDAGEYRIVDVNTNRGQRKHWGGDLDLPDTLAAYVRTLEARHGTLFLGDAGRLFREGLANREKFLAKWGAAYWERHQELKRRSGRRFETNGA